jgi:hypothetical protein
MAFDTLSIQVVKLGLALVKVIEVCTLEGYSCVILVDL